MTEIREMRPEDVPALALLESRCFSDPWSEKLFGELIDSSLDRVWVLEQDGAFAGYCNFRIIAGEGELMRIAVCPELRGRGYGRKLMERLAENAAENRVDAVTLEVRASNRAAIGLYEAFGFKKEAVRKRYYSNPEEDALIYWLRRS